MNIKTFLTIALLSLVPLSVSTGTSGLKANENESVEIKNAISSTPCKQSNDTMPWAVAWQNVDYKGHKPNSDDDGKTHHHHFERLNSRRRKIIFCFLGKLILLVTYLSSLISLYHECLH